VTVRDRYLLGLGVVVVLGSVLILVLPPALRRDAAWGGLIALGLQAPLGWWTIRSIGMPRFQLVWTVGMGIRLAAVAVTGLVLVPIFGWDSVAVLGALVAALLLLLSVEAVTAVREHSH
jgi:hypothetical protein